MIGWEPIREGEHGTTGRSLGSLGGARGLAADQAAADLLLADEFDVDV